MYFLLILFIYFIAGASVIEQSEACACGRLMHDPTIGAGRNRGVFIYRDETLEGGAESTSAQSLVLPEDSPLPMLSNKL